MTLHTTQKEAGYRQGADNENSQNGYILSNSIQTLEAFFEVVSAGAFPRPLQEKFQGYVSAPESNLDAYKQTSNTKQISVGTIDPTW